MVSFISATTINSWAEGNPRRAQEILPELVIRLILTTSTKIKDFNFPIENGIQYSGYDGILDSGEETEFFPKGRSVWECGTNSDIMGKFKSDIDKRYNEPLGEDIKNTVFMFVTLKIWNHKTSIGELLNESKEKYDWKDIRIIDGSKIALWMSRCPAVAIWFSEIIGEYISGVMSAEQYWDEYCNSTTPKLTSDFLCIGRTDQVKKIKKWIEDDRDYKIVSSESSLESLLFVLSVIISLSQNEKNKFLSKVIIVQTLNAWNNLLPKCHNKDIILIPIFNFNEDFCCPDSISVLFPISKYSTFAQVDSIDKIELPVWSSDAFDEALKELGYNSTDISKIEDKTKRRFMPFYRIITNHPSRKRPKWTDKSNIKELIPIMLVGRWNVNYDGDKEIISAISGKKYEEYIETLSEWLSIEDAPVFTGLSRYESVSVQDLWDFIFTKLTSDTLDTFRKCVIDIFKEEDETFTLPEEQWSMAAMLGKKAKYSNELRQGIVISLIILSEKKDANCNIISTENFVYGLVKDILSPINTWQHWNTIAPFLPLLAEASPTAVLEKLEYEFQNVNSDIWRLFKPSEDLLLGTSYYTYILWALETLTWYKRYAVRAIKIFAEISEKNLEYNMANTPDESLYNIFCLWNPQSCLDNDERIRVIKQICKTHPICTWRLIGKLLPKYHNISMPISKPKWRECDEILYESPMSQKEYRYMLKAVINIIIENVSSNKEQWVTIIQNISTFQNVFEPISEKCIICCNKMNENDVMSICNELREQIYSFRKFRNAEWTVSKEYIDKLEDLFYKILPNSINQYIYLFTWHPDILNPFPLSEDNDSDFKQEQKLICDARKEAIDSIFKEYGQDALIDFCKYAQDVSDLGDILTEILLEGEYRFDIIKRIKEKNYGLYSRIIYTLLVKNGLDNSIDVLLKDKSLSDIEKGDILCQFQLSPEVWGQISMFPEKAINYYWEHVRAFPNDWNQDTHNYCVTQLINYKRPFSAVHYISMSKYNNTKMIIEVLEKCVELKNTTEPNGMTIKSSSYYYYIQLFKKIYKDKNIDNFRVVKLEIAFLSCFENETPQCLIKYLEQTPQEYINLISMAFKQDNSTMPPDDNKRKWANFAYKILSKFNRIPGCNDDIQSEEIFLNWVNQVKDIAVKREYCKGFELCLGNLLSYAPIGTDDIFPHEIIRNFFENNNSEIIIGEFLVGKYNQRGVHILTEGTEEEKIAQKYFEDADKIRIEYPHTASILDELGRQYLGEAQHERKRAQMDFR